MSYYARRASAGVGLIVTEGTYVGHDSAGQSDDIPRFHGEKQLAGWKKVVDAVHAAGGTIAPQLWHRRARHRAPDQLTTPAGLFCQHLGHRHTRIGQPRERVLRRTERGPHPLSFLFLP